jgi:hypothetical protein
LDPSEDHGSVLVVLVEIFGLITRIDLLRNLLLDTNNGTTSLRNVFDIAATAVNYKADELSHLLTMICDLIGMNGVGIFEKKTEAVDLVLGCKNVEAGAFSPEDPMFRVARRSTGLIIPISHDDCLDTAVSSNFKEKFTRIVLLDLVDSLLVIFVGTDLTLNFSQLLMYFRPIVLVFLKNFQLRTCPIESTQPVDLAHSKLLDSDISSRLFSVTQFSDMELLECVIKMFHNLDLINPLGLSIDQFTSLIIRIRDGYCDVPFHNWSHAVDTVQFVYSSLVRGRLRRHFHPLQMSALLLATLCHDVGHRGLNTLYHNKAETHLTMTFGSQSTLERYHAQLAREILERGGLRSFDNPMFSKFFVSCIVATDMVRHFEFFDGFKQVVKRFDYANELHRLALAQFLIKCGNFANTTRPFDVAVHFAACLRQEYDSQGEEEMKINVEMTKFGDRDGMSLWDIENAFLTGIAGPTLKLLGEFVGDLSDFNLQMEDNKKKWIDYGIKQSE